MKTIAKKAWTTGIGSLPHHNVDAALEYSFKMTLPFLPQIPIRNPWEFMIPQALEGLPGLQVEEDGMVTLHVNIWESQSHILDQRLKDAFSNRISFESFEPSAATSSCWQPFLWELQERGYQTAKIQTAGPLTCQWALKLKNGSSPDQYPELCTQIFQLILARSLAMTKRMLSCGIQPVLYLDEPGLYALSLHQPKHVLALQELKLMIQTLRKEGALVGLHCCSNAEWDVVFDLGLDILSIDTALSLDHALVPKNGEGMLRFVKQGGILSLGVIPTGRSSILHSLNPNKIKSQLQETFDHSWENQTQLIQKILAHAIYTPACGLALQSTTDVELILEKLMGVYEHFHT